MTAWETDVPDNMDKNPALSISSYRLLYIYLLLAQTEQVFFQDLNTQLLNHPLIERVFTGDTMNKYLNTLRLFGCNITRFEDRGHVLYKLNNHPLKLHLSQDEMQAIRGVCQLLSQQPVASTFKDFYFLVHRLSRVSSMLEPNPMLSLGLEMDPIVSRQLFQLAEQFQKYCQEAQVLEICCHAEDEDPSIPRLVEPEEVIYRKKRLYLVGNDPKTNKKVRYDIEQIRSHRQLPNRIRSQVMKTTVIFKLTGRVALNYRPYPNEVVSNKGECVLIKHQTDEVEQLLRRLLKYGPNCQVISPDSVRQEMLHMVEHLIDGMAETPPEDLLSALANTAQTDATLHKWLCYLDTLQTLGGVADD